MAVTDFLFGAPNRIEQVNRGFNPGQLSTLQNLLSGGQNLLNNPSQGFQPIRQAAQSDFNQNIIPGIAERFAGAGALNSSGFAGNLAQAGSGLAERLAAMEAQFAGQNRQQALQQLQMGLTPTMENIPVQGEGGFLQSILPSLGKVGMGAVGAGLTGGWSAILPALGALLSQMALPSNQKN